MNLEETTTAFVHLLLVFYMSRTAMSKAVSPCEVHPKDVVVATGDPVSLNCSASSSFSVASWQLGADVLTKLVVYTAPVYGPDGSIRTPKFVATDRGYAVDDGKESEAILEINKTTLAHAGPYYCTCSDKDMTAALGAVVVIDPKLSTNASDCNGQPVAINCSVSSSEDISYVMAIEDAFGQTFAIKNGSSSCKDVLTSSCQLTYVIAANESRNETFICTVNVTTSKNIRFSKMLKTSIEYSTDCSGNANSQNSPKEWNHGWLIATPIIGVVLCCIIMLAFVVLVLPRLKRKDEDLLTNGSQDSKTGART